MIVLIIAHWRVFVCEGKFYLPSTHYSYCQYLIERNDSLHLACLTIPVDCVPSGYAELGEQVTVHPLPSYRNYWTVYLSLNKYRSFFSNVFASIPVDLVYVRAPDPLCWLPALCGRGTRKLNYHFVGDAIDTTMKAKGAFWKRLIKCLLYLPEYLALVLVCALFADKVLCNGPHLKIRLRKIGLRKVKEVISSTISQVDVMPLPERPDALPAARKLLYVGYLRPAKGVFETLEAFNALRGEYPDLQLSVVGAGEDSPRLLSYVEKNGLEGAVHFLGHVDDKAELQRIYREHDLFCFFSFSEGSPRVVLEAMINGLVVASSPVGSLPYCFTNLEDIVFSKDYSVKSIGECLSSALAMSAAKFSAVRYGGYQKVKNNYLREKFLSEIFS